VARFDRTIPPGGLGKIVLSLDSKKVHDAFNKTATIQSNDTSHPGLRITLKGVLRRWIDVDPERLFLRGYEDDKPHAAIRIVSNLKEPLVVKLGSAPELKGKLDCELKTVLEGKEYRLEVVNKAGIGRYNGNIILLTNSATKPQISVPVFADITGNVGYYPNILELGRVTAKEKDQVARVITIWKNKGEDLKLGKITYNKDRFDVDVKQQGPRFVISVKPKLASVKPGEFKDELRIETSAAELPLLVVPVHGWVQ
jgi:hypothetical protein